MDTKNTWDTMPCGYLRLADNGNSCHAVQIYSVSKCVHVKPGGERILQILRYSYRDAAGGHK